MTTSHFSGLNLKVTALSEGIAGNFTVSGITSDDLIVAVVGVRLTLTEGTPNTVACAAVNVTPEFSITAANTINNSGGTSLADTVAFCIWLDKDAA